MPALLRPGLTGGAPILEPPAERDSGIFQAADDALTSGPAGEVDRATPPPTSSGPRGSDPVAA